MLTGHHGKPIANISLKLVFHGDQLALKVFRDSVLYSTEETINF
jgi:hypothetical protein